MPAVLKVSEPLPRSALVASRLGQDLVKAVVDVERRVMAVGGELHSDEEQFPLEDGSRQRDLWGINLYLDDQTSAWIEFDSMINLRPTQGNRSRGVEDPAVQTRILAVVNALVIS